MTQQITILPRSTPKHDHVPVRIGERGYGFIGDSGTIGMSRCHCGEEIPGPGVVYGYCNACGFDLKEEIKKQYPELF